MTCAQALLTAVVQAHQGERGRTLRRFWAQRNGDGDDPASRVLQLESDSLARTGQKRASLETPTSISVRPYAHTPHRAPPVTLAVAVQPVQAQIAPSERQASERISTAVRGQSTTSGRSSAGQSSCTPTCSPSLVWPCPSGPAAESKPTVPHTRADPLVDSSGADKNSVRRWLLTPVQRQRTVLGVPYQPAAARLLKRGRHDDLDCGTHGALDDQRVRQRRWRNTPAAPPCPHDTCTIPA